MDLDSLLALALEHRWFAVGALVVGALVRLSKTEAMGRMFTDLHPLVKRLVPLALGAALGVLESLASGRPLQEALVKGAILAGGGAMLGHDAGIEGMRNKREIGS
jgi:uncharacterized membrane protein YebE (DUF533 family)